MMGEGGADGGVFLLLFLSRVAYQVCAGCCPSSGQGTRHMHRVTAHCRAGRAVRPRGLLPPSQGLDTWQETPRLRRNGLPGHPRPARQQEQSC